MKKSAFLAAISLFAATTAYLAFSGAPVAGPTHARPGPTALPLPSILPSDQLADHDLPTTNAGHALGNAMGSPRQPRLLPGEHRYPRSAIAAVLPGIANPPADWRTFCPAKLTVAPLPGLPLDFAASSVTNDGRRTTWIGRNAEQGATLVACATETSWDAIITIPGADEYSVQITPETVRTFETSPGRGGCAAGTLSTSSLRAAAAAITPGPASAATAGTTLNTSDLLILYDTGTKNDWGSATETENRIAAVVATINTYLADSKVDNLQWHLAGTAETPAYATTGSLEDDLNRLANPATELGRFAREKRIQYGADQVMLIVSGDRDYAGIAHTPGHFSVVLHPGTAATVAHELGHNFGCQHDRETEEVADGDGKYYYAHRFTHDNRDIGTIMSYADYYVAYFSNPTITYQGIAVGIESGQPKAADNARWLREHAEDIAGLLPSKTVTAPTISTQPTAVTVTAGQSFSLSVTASGNSLSYQWSKGGTDIAGATAATYSKTSSTAADAGTYSVLVSNSAGSVRSSNASVTVNPAPVVTPPPSSSGSGGGGGGGGALGCAAALGLLTLLGISRRRR